MSLAINNIRQGHKYRLQNFSEVTSFEVLKVKGGNDFLIKDLLSLEEYMFSDLIKFGKGKDFILEEIEN